MNYTVLMLGVILALGCVLAWLVMAYSRMRASEQTVDRAWNELKDALADRFDVFQQVLSYSKKARDKELEQSVLRAMNFYSTSYKTDDPQIAGRGEKIFMTETLPLLADSIKSENTMSETLSLREDVARTDGLLKSERKKYNEIALRHNNNIAQIPTNMLASIFRLKEKTTFLAPEDADRQLLNLSFD